MVYALPELGSVFLPHISSTSHVAHILQLHALNPYKLMSRVHDHCESHTIGCDLSLQEGPRVVAEDGGGHDVGKISRSNS